MDSNFNFTMDIVKTPEYMTVFEWEKDFDFQKTQKFFTEKWNTSLYIGALYVMLVFIGKNWMQNRAPYKLSRSLIFWNTFLAAFSIMGFSRTIPEFLHVISDKDGLHKSICSREHFNSATVFWSWMMVFSKGLELIDTAFIILRKQKLIFLHWYHHLTVMLFAVYTYESFDSCNRWFVCINFGIHSLMYSYYAMRASGIKISRNIAMIITTLQVIQMIFGVYVNIYTLYIKAQGHDCGRLNRNIYLSSAMYFSYLILFVNFFVKTYSKKPSTSSIAKEKKSS